MTTEEFVGQLKDLAPSRETFVNRGLSEDYIKGVLESYNCDWKNNSSIHKDPLLRLVDCYTADTIKIGSIDFNARIAETRPYYIVGEVEVDWLVIDKHTGIVKIVEKNIYTDMWECAADGSKFLDAILEAEKFFTKRSQDDDLYNNRNITQAVAESCSYIAGGDRYSDFYKMFVGCW